MVKINNIDPELLNPLIQNVGYNVFPGLVVGIKKMLGKMGEQWRRKENAEIWSRDHILIK